MPSRLTRSVLMIACGLALAPVANAATERPTLAAKIESLHERIKQSPYPLDFNPGRELYLFVKSAPPASYSEADIRLLGQELSYYRVDLPDYDTFSLRHYAAESLGYIGPRAAIVRNELQFALFNEGCFNRQSGVLTIGAIPEAMKQIGLKPQPIDCSKYTGVLRLAGG